MIERLMAGRPAWQVWLGGLLLAVAILIAILLSFGRSRSTPLTASTSPTSTPLSVGMVASLTPTVGKEVITRQPTGSPTGTPMTAQDGGPSGAETSTATLLVSPSPTSGESFSAPSPTLSPTVQSTPAATPLPSPTPSPPELPFHGIEVRQLADVAVTSQAGAYWLRYNALRWYDVEPQPGVRDWSGQAALESQLKAAAAQGQQVILIVRGTPGWAQQVPGSSCGPIRADQLPAFAAFMADAVARYSQPPYNVKYWELGNEPDVDATLVPPDSQFGCWGKIGDPFYGGDDYAEMLKVVYPQIKAVDPQAQVLTGGLLLDCDPVNPPETTPGSGQYRDCTPSRFLEGILHNGGGDFFDGVSFHAYDFYDETTGRYSNDNWHSAWNTTGPVVIAKARYLNGLLAQYGYAGKYLMNTEGAILCGRSGQEPYCTADDFTALRAAYVVEEYTAALAENVTANVWYSLTGWRASGLVNKGRTPNSSYQAYRFNVDQLEGTTFWGEVNAYPAVRGYEFVRLTDQGEQIHTWVLWALDAENHTIVLPQTPSAVYDSLGNSLPTSATQLVTLLPIYVTWNP